MNVDFGKTSKDYGRYRAGFPPEFFARLHNFGIGKPEQHILDIGTGTGTVARGLAKQGCNVTALDKSPEQIEQAKELDSEAGIHIDYLISKAEEIDLPDSSFDVITAGQCWHWFDRAIAAREVKRLLVPDGHLVIAHFNWIPLPGNVLESTENLIREYNPELKDFPYSTGIYSDWLTDLAIAGFNNIETFSFDVFVPYSHEAWRGRVRASAGVGATLPSEKVAEFDADLEKILTSTFPDDPMAVHHRVFAVISSK